MGGDVMRSVRARMRRLLTRKGGEGMDVRLVCESGVERHQIEELPRLLERRDAVVWVDIPLCDQQAVNVLSGVFGFHPIAVRDCTERNHVSKVHIYPDYVFFVLHTPKVGKRGHVHYVELDQFVGRNYLVTVHGPLNPAVAPEVAFLDTNTVTRRLEKKQLRMASPFELSYGIVSSMIRREADLIADLAKESGLLEQRVMLGEDLEDPEAFWRSCSKRGMCSSPFAQWPRTAAQLMGGWHDLSASYLMRHPHCSPTSQISSRSSRRWLTVSGSSCTASLSSTRRGPQRI
jgi:hypothetical protein